MDIEEEGRERKRGREREQSNNGSTGQQLVHGCILIIPQAARASSNLVVSLSLFLLPPPVPSCPLPPFADEPWCTTEMRRNKNRRDGPPLQPSEPCPSASASVRSNSWSFLSSSLPPPYPRSIVFSAGSLLLGFTSSTRLSAFMPDA